MTLIFNSLLQVAKVYVYAKFHHQSARFMSYRVNREEEKTREKKLATMLKTILPSLPRAVINITGSRTNNNNYSR